MNDFDPYREWLGITSNRKPTYYQLINVSPSEEDANIIRQSAVHTLEKLSRIEDPSHQKLRNKLIKRVRRAAKCLMTDELRITYDRKLLAQNEEDASQLGQAEEFDVGLLQSPTEPNISTATPGIKVTADAKPKSSVSKKYKSQQRRSVAILLSGVLAFIGLVGIGFLVVTQTDFGKSLLDAPASTAKESTDSFDDDAEPLPMDSEDFEETEIESDAIAQVNDSVATADTTDEPRDREPPTTEDIMQLQEALFAARAALENRETARAEQILKAAKTLNKRELDNEMFERLETLSYLVSEYWSALDDALESLESGKEIRLGEHRVMVVEVNDDELVVRSQGANRTLQRNNLPLDLEIALADRWFDQNAASSSVFRGAMMAVSSDYSKEEVRQLWRQAKQQGAEIDDLEKVLEDNYDLLNDTSE